MARSSWATASSASSPTTRPRRIRPGPAPGWPGCWTRPPWPASVRVSFVSQPVHVMPCTLSTTRSLEASPFSTSASAGLLANP